MRSFRFVMTSCLWILCLSETARVSAQDRKEEGLRLLRQALELSNVYSEGAPAYRLKGSVKFVTAGGASEEGTYLETWVSRKQWRRELHVGGTHRLEVAQDDSRWLSDQSNAFTPWVGLLMPHFTTIHQQPPTKFKVKSIRDETISGTPVRCVELSGPRSVRATFCVATQSGVVISSSAPISLADEGKEVSCQFGDHARLGTKMVPRRIRCELTGEGSMSAQVDEVSSESVFAPEQFVHPQGAIELKNCLGELHPPSLAHRSPKIKYPQGKPPAPPAAVVLWMIVKEDGHPDQLRVLQSQGTAFDESARQAVEKWTFKPATCDATPLAFEFGMQIRFKKF